MANNIKILLAINLLFYGFLFSASLQEADSSQVFEFAEENQLCFNCHGGKFYYYYNDWIEREVRERMNPYFIVDSALFYRSNHKTFRCTDCHSMDYENFPHDGELRMEEKYTCADCHEGDEDYVKYNFEGINEEFQKSVHSTKHSEDFTCWMCHNPHTYEISARIDSDINHIISYDNAICLDCHADIDRYQLIIDAENPSIIDMHDWLPNQALHFQNVRCIECHAEIKDDILVAHKVQEKEKAVKNCVECHSQNSILLASLYKYQAAEERSSLGFFNATILNNAYIIGANRNYYLNLFSLIIFGCVIGGIIIHSILRIIKT